MILLIGDYSSVHSELCSELKKNKYNVLLLSDGDSYKQLPYDIKVPDLKFYNSGLINKILTFIRFFGFFGLINYLKIKKILLEIPDINVVQLINPVAIPSLGALGNLLLIRFLRNKCDVISLCALGDDYNWVKACLENKYKYSAMDRLFHSVDEFLSYINPLKYVYSPLYRYLNHYVIKKCDLIIPGLTDYELAYASHGKVTELIGLPVSNINFNQPKETKYPIKIFHAWQSGKESRKGNEILDKIVKKYISKHGNEKVIYEVVNNLPFNEYLSKYKNSDIIFDQVYSYDRGVTAALGMASGKVVFSGFEDGNFIYGINATADEEKLYCDFVTLIKSIDLIDSIKKNAYQYALKNYSSDIVCKKYIKQWFDCLD